ncbi:MAG TPA: glutamate-cysteine ligase family protein [Oscillatoriaceae cyanobacterium]
MTKLRGTTGYMGDIDVRQATRDEVLDTPDCLSLRRAVFEPGFGQPGAIGVEIETFVFERGKTVSLGMDGSGLTPGNFLTRLGAIAGPDAKLVRDPLNGYATGLSLPSGGKFCLENGGQVEYASSTQIGLAAIAAELHDALALCERAAEGTLGFLSHGTHPTLEERRDPLVPNSRYRIMERFFAPDSIHRWGNYTASIQVNLDVPDPEAWPEALRLGFLLSRFAYPLFANSRYLHGRPFPGGSARTHLLAGVDRGRQVVPAGAIRSADPVEAYVQWALDASVIFAGDLPLEELPRRGELSFREWILHGYRGKRPGLAHWQLHLGTLWPDVRPRRFIELRATDAQPFEYIMAAVAFWQALIQTEEGREALRGFFAGMPDDLLQREPGDALFRETRTHRALLELAAGVLERTGGDRWAGAVRDYARYREEVVGTLPLHGADFVARTRCDAPASAFIGRNPV